MRLDAHSLLYSGAVQHRRPSAGAMLETCGWAGVYTLCPERDTSQGGTWWPGEVQPCLG